AIVVMLRNERRGYPLRLEIASRHAGNAAAKGRTRSQRDLVGKEFCYGSFRRGPDEGIETSHQRPLERRRPIIDQDQPRQSADCLHARATVEAECADPQVQPPDRGGGCMRRKDAVEGIGKNIDIGDAWPLPGLIDQENDGYIRKYESKEATG